MGLWLHIHRGLDLPLLGLKKGQLKGPEGKQLKREGSQGLKILNTSFICNKADAGECGLHLWAEDSSDILGLRIRPSGDLRCRTPHIPSVEGAEQKASFLPAEQLRRKKVRGKPEVTSLQIPPALLFFLKSLWLFRVFCVSTQIVKLS